MVKLNEKCLARHEGVWAYEPSRFATAWSLVQQGAYPEIDAMAAARDHAVPVVDEHGVLVLDMVGPVTKGFSKYGGTSTVAMRETIREAAKDDSVKGILLHIDSPGGTVAGTQELANDVAAFTLKKPMAVHASGIMASAAYWIGAWATTIAADETTEVGSLGTYLTVVDSSGAAEMEGIKVHLVTSGEFKGLGAAGVEVSDTHLAHLQEVIDDINGLFMRDVSAARGFDVVGAGIADGRTFIASKALGHGLIDRVQSLDESYAQLVGMVNDSTRASRARRARAMADSLRTA